MAICIFIVIISAIAIFLSIAYIESLLAAMPLYTRPLIVSVDRDTISTILKKSSVEFAQNFHLRLC